MIYYFAADENGLDSVQSVIDSNADKLLVVPIPSYETWDNYSEPLMGKVKKGDVVILDTLSMFAETTRADLKLGNDANIRYWQHRQKLLGESNYGADYKAAQQLIMRRLKNFVSLGANIIVTTHEKEKEDHLVSPPIKRRGPDLNDALLGNLIGSSSDVARLRVIFEDEFSGEKLKFKRGQRVLEFGPSDEYMSKTHVGLEMSGKVPSAITRPSYTKVCKALAKKPTWLTVYGPPGCGKSTFALSMLIDPNGEGIGV